MNHVTDLLSVVSLPEWSAAAVILQALISACLHTRRQSSQDAKREGKENKESVALKAVALDIFKEMAPLYAHRHPSPPLYWCDAMCAGATDLALCVRLW